MKTCKSYESDGKGLNNNTAGSGDTLEFLLRKHNNTAWQYAYDLAGNLEEAKELVQKASYRILRNWETYDPLKSFMGWYLTIVKNLFEDTRRSFSRRRVVSLDIGAGDNGTLADMLADDAAGIQEQLERKETVDAIRETLKTLDEKHLDVVTLCDINGMPYEEAAQKLGIPGGTVRSRLSRAHSLLRRKLKLEQIV